ncbi:MAG: peptide chain release factor N(5)-glutamine methyltransferase [Bacteroidota bacterium]
METRFTLAEFKDFAKKSLKNIYPSEEIESIIYLVFEKHLNLKKIDVLLNNNYTVPGKKIDELLSIIDELKKQKPIQYILGETEFYNLTLKVDDQTLIPRQETEELVDWIIKNDQGNSQKILDIGTGTGCIAIALAKYLPKSSVEGIDFSEKIIRKASENAYLNHVEVRFSVLNILKEELSCRDYDLIVSNPPYVRESEKKFMHGNVLEFEPEDALFVPDSKPLVFYERITEVAGNHLRPKGEIYLEINEYFSHEVIQLLERNDFIDVILKNDINNKPRMIKATKQ